MKRLLWSALLAALLGPVAFGQGTGKYMSHVGKSPYESTGNPTFRPEVPNLVGPWGQPIEMKMPYAANPAQGAEMAKTMLSHNVPLDLAAAMQRTAAGGGLAQAQYCGPGGCNHSGGGMPAFGPGMAPGMGMPGMGPGMGMPGMGMPGMGGPGGPGGMPVSLNPGSMNPLQGLMPGSAQRGGPLGYPGAVAAVGALTPNGPGQGGPFQASRTQVRFVGPTGMRISWYAPSPDGRAFTSEYLEAPGRYNFMQAAIYRLKLTNLPNRTNLPALYPTLEVVPATAKTATFLAHSSVPISFTEEDIEQVAAGNFLVKVIYLPDPQFQDLAATGPDEVVSTRLEPGVDPINEALRRGSILAIIRLGNSDLEAPNTPAMDAPPPGAQGRPVPGAPGAPGVPGAPGAPGTGAPTGPGAPGAGGQASMLGIPGGGNPFAGLPRQPHQHMNLGAPGPSLAPSISPMQGPKGSPYLAPSPVPGLPSAVQGSGPPPVIDPRTLPPTPPVNPSKTTSTDTKPTTSSSLKLPSLLPASR